MPVFYEKRCKICNSQLKNKIEKLYVEASLSPEKIFEYLNTLAPTEEQQICLTEGFSAMSVRRHLKSHFDIKAGVKIKHAENINKLEQSKKDFELGVDKKIDAIAHLNHLITSNMIHIEEVENTLEGKIKHEKIIQYANSIKGLIETVSKLTGELKQEGSIDINFFNDEIGTFANIVLSTMRTLDGELNLDGKLEEMFATEFGRQWTTFNERRERIVSGELNTSEENNHKNVNTFNEGV